jgi:hypothetical protein
MPDAEDYYYIVVFVGITFQHLCYKIKARMPRRIFSLIFPYKFSLYRYITRLKSPWFAANTTPINLLYRKVLYSGCSSQTQYTTALQGAPGGLRLRHIPEDFES